MRLSTFVGTLAFAIGICGVARAQSSADCQTAQRSIGVAVGRSSPYFEPAIGVGDASSSVSSSGGLAVAGRADLPIAGAWRARVEGLATTWRLEQQTYSADLQEVIDHRAIGRIGVRQAVALVGRQGGRWPACGYVLAGGGLYSLSYQHQSFRTPGFALTAGIEFPGGPRGFVQVGVDLHLISIDASHRYPIGSSAVVTSALSAAWLYRF